MTSPSGEDVQWYYAAGDTRQGPVDTATLLATVSGLEDPGMVRVWRQGMAEWQRAEAHPELSAHLSPRVPPPPAAATQSARSPGGTLGPSDDAPRYDPWFSMWLKPRDTIRQIVATDPEWQTSVVAALAGITAALDRASTRSLGDRMPLAAVLAAAVILGSVSGIIGLRISAVLVEWTGQRLGGRAVREHIRAALAWGAVPGAWALVPWVALLILGRGDMFTEATPYLDAHPGITLLTLVPLLALIVIAIWSPFTICKALGEVQGFSARRALANVLLAGLVIAVPVLLVALLVATTASAAR